jgi:hypothetical protein
MEIKMQGGEDVLRALVGAILGGDEPKKPPIKLPELEQLGRDYAAEYKIAQKAHAMLVTLNLEMRAKGIKEAWGPVVDGYAHHFVPSKDGEPFGCGASDQSKIDHRHDELGQRCEVAWYDYSRKAIASNKKREALKDEVSRWIHELTCECVHEETT